MNDLSIIFYTSNSISDYCMANVQEKLLRAVGDTTIISVSFKPTVVGNNCTNIVWGDQKPSVYNIYKMILLGAEEAKTEYCAMAEDDVLYSKEHFEYRPSKKDVFAYDMNKWSIFTWSKPQRFSYRENRRTMTSLVVSREALIKTLEERYAKYPVLEDIDPNIYKYYWGEPSRFERHVGITEVKSEKYFASVPHIIFSHDKALGFSQLGHRKAHGSVIKYELEPWGTAESI